MPRRLGWTAKPPAATTTAVDVVTPSGTERGKRPKTPRLLPEQRRALLLERATQFFAESGMSAPTRALADACGVAQRLLYRYFPSKAALLRDVYQAAILAPFQAEWLSKLRDRSIPVEQRLCHFYEEYYANVLSRRWMRLFLFGALDGADMAPAYIQAVIFELLATVTVEAAAERRVTLPKTPALLHEIGWILHGTVSHLAVRQHIYGASFAVPIRTVLALHVSAFLDGLPAAAARAHQAES